MVQPKPATVRVEAPTGEHDAPRIYISGEIDIASAAVVLSGLLNARERHPGSDFIIDISEVEFIDSTGLQSLLRFRHELRDDDRVLVLLGANGNVLAMFEMIGLDDILLIATEQKQAERMLAGLHTGALPG